MSSAAQPRRWNRYRVTCTAKNLDGARARVRVRATRPRATRHAADSPPAEGREITTVTASLGRANSSARIATPTVLMFSVTPPCHSVSSAARYHTGSCSGKRRGRDPDEVARRNGATCALGRRQPRADDMATDWASAVPRRNAVIGRENPGKRAGARRQSRSSPCNGYDILSSDNKPDDEMAIRTRRAGRAHSRASPARVGSSPRLCRTCG